jgi:hypothetical protein
MVLHHFRLIFLAISLTAVLLSPSMARAADKVKFSSPRPNATIPTQPTPTLEILIPERPANFSDGGATFAPPLAPSMNTTVRSGKAEDNDQDNWIFRDTKSAQGIQRALGVETYGADSSAAGQAESITVVEEYFVRQNKFQPQELTPENRNPLDRLESSFSSGGNAGKSHQGNDSFFSGNGSDSVGSPYGGDQRGFQNTINSANPATRSFYREMYKEQISPSKPVIPALSAPTPIEQPPASTVSRTRQLYNRAAYIESMTPKGPVSVFDQNLGQAQQPVVTEPDKSTIYSVPTPERRGGKTVLPTRPF